MSQTEYTYLDYAASAPLRKEALIAMNNYLASPYGHANPNSLHTQGRGAASALRQARRDIAQCLGRKVRPDEIVFTSGGTESNNMALFGMANAVRAKDRHRNKVIISAIEHDSVLDVVGPLKNQGFEVLLVRPDSTGKINSATLKGMVDTHTCLVSIMYANNETGVIQDIKAYADITKRQGAYFHTDAIQAFGRIRLDIENVDAISMAAHKIGGPTGVGALYIKTSTPFKPISFGGGQELGRRAGTQDVVGAVGFASAAKYVMEHIDQTRPKVEAMATACYQKICQNPNIIPTTDTSAKGDLPGLVSVMVKGFDSEVILLKLDSLGYEISSGSACATGSLDPSHVLSAMGIASDLSFGQLRISFDERVTMSQLNGFSDALLSIIK